MLTFLEKIFDLKKHQTCLKQEFIGGFTTFVTMSYIIFVQPLILSAAGMDKGAVMTATCLASALAMLIMAFTANYPFALAPAMGHNVYFVFTVCLGMGLTWQTALGANFISGMIFLLISFWGFREKLITAVPESLKNAIAVGIGFLITLIGLEWSGLVKADPGTLISLGDLHHPAPLLSLFGLLLMAFLISKKIKGAIILGISANLVLALIFGMTEFQGITGKIPSLAPTFLKLDIRSALNWEMLGVIFVFFFLDLFDTVGTLIGLGQQADFIKNGKIPKARQALFSDAAGTVAGNLLGTSTITAYIESSTGISSGARTGLANLVTAGFFLLSLMFYPLVKMVSSPVNINGFSAYPVIAPALIIVGSFMLKNVRSISWDDFTEAFPAFMTMILMPLTFSITEGISFGFISYTFLKLVTGKIRSVPHLISGFSLLFILRYIFLI